MTHDDASRPYRAPLATIESSVQSDASPCVTRHPTSDDAHDASFRKLSQE